MDESVAGILLTTATLFVHAVHHEVLGANATVPLTRESLIAATITGIGETLVMTISDTDIAVGMSGRETTRGEMERLAPRKAVSATLHRLPRSLLATVQQGLRVLTVVLVHWNNGKISTYREGRQLFQTTA
jgi:hypothetical protein